MLTRIVAIQIYFLLWTTQLLLYRRTAKLARVLTVCDTGRVICTVTRSKTFGLRWKGGTKRPLSTARREGSRLLNLQISFLETLHNLAVSARSTKLPGHLDKYNSSYLPLRSKVTWLPPHPPSAGCWCRGGSGLLTDPQGRF